MQGDVTHDTPLAGRLADRFGHRVALVSGALLFAAAMLLRMPATSSQYRGACDGVCRGGWGGTSTVEAYLNGTLIYRTTTASVTGPILTVQIGNKAKGLALGLVADNIAVSWRS